MDAVSAATIATAAAALLSALGTLALALLARKQVNALQQQVTDSAQQVEASQRSADAAQESAQAARDSVEAARDTVMESARVRADEHSPRVVATFLEPEWPPLYDPQRYSIPQGGHEPLLADAAIERSEPLEDGHEFIFDRDRQKFLWFRVRGLLVNEGESSALVGIGSQTRIISESSVGNNDIDMPIKIGPEARYLFRPGQSVQFEWAVGNFAGKWADNYNTARPKHGFLEIPVSDFQEHGVLDHIFAVFGARPLEPVVNQEGHWRLRDKGTKTTSSSAAWTVVYPTRRTYRWDWPSNRKPPWAEDES